jgi:hypothetical protein
MTKQKFQLYCTNHAHLAVREWEEQKATIEAQAKEIDSLRDVLQEWKDEARNKDIIIINLREEVDILENELLDAQEALELYE